MSSQTAAIAPGARGLIRDAEWIKKHSIAGRQADGPSKRRRFLDPGHKEARFLSRDGKQKQYGDWPEKRIKRFKLRSLPMVVVQQPTEPFTAADTRFPVHRFWEDKPISETLMVSFPVMMRYQILDARRNECSPNRIKRSKQDSLIDLTKRSAHVFKFADCGGSFTHVTPTLVQNVLKVCCVQRIAIMDQVAFSI
jgi:hypothetical protein